MKSIFILIYFFLPALFLTAQTEDIDPSKGPVAETEFQQEDWTVFGKDGSIEFSEQTALLYTDAGLRQKTYPGEYDLQQVPDLLEEQKLMLSLWTLINLYPSHPAEVQTIALKLAQRGIGGQHYLSCFYTYAFADPEIFHFEEGSSPYLKNPVRMEEKMDACKELAGYAQRFITMIHSSNKK